MSQLDLMGGEHPLDEPELTDRQQLALQYVQANQPIDAGELGALLHQDRRTRGGRGHSADARCEWCTEEGRQMLHALRGKGLVRQRKGIGWVTTRTVADNAFGDFPDGF